MRRESSEPSSREGRGAGRPVADAGAAGAEGVVERAWPPLRIGQPPSAPAFPIDVFPTPLQAYAAELAAATQTPVDMAAGVMLAAASAAIGQSFQLELKSSWKESPLLYLMLVVPPGGKKTPVTHLVLEPLYAIDARLRQCNLVSYRKWGYAMLSHRVNHEYSLRPEEPRRRRLVVRDIAREPLCILVRDNPRGLLCVPDEGTAWIASFNEYKGKGADRKFWLSNHSGSPVSVDRKAHRESFHLEYPFVSVVAGIQPEMLSTLCEEQGRDDGLLDRILFVMPDPSAWPQQRWSPATPTEQGKKMWTDVIEKLYAREMVCERTDPSERKSTNPPPESSRSQWPRPVQFSPEGERAWGVLYDWLGSALDAPRCTPSRRAALSKAIGASARLALILSRLRLALKPKGDLNGPVEPEDVQAAARLIRYFDAMRARVDATLGGSGAQTPAARIVAWLRRNARTQFCESDLRSDLRRSLNDDERAIGLQELQAGGVIRPLAGAGSGSGSGSSRPGRKPSDAYEVHPELFAAPAAPAAVADDLAAGGPFPVIPVIPGAGKGAAQRRSA